MKQFLVLCALIAPCLSNLDAEIRTILPTPQDLQFTEGKIWLYDATVIEFLLPADQSEKIKIAIDLVERTFKREGLTATISRNDLRQLMRDDAVQIILSSYPVWIREGEPQQGDVLDPIDRRLLDGGTTGQEYVLWVDPHTARIYLIGSGDQGVLNAAATLRQLLKSEDSGVSIPGVQIRDYPDFEYRVAADWLMNVEIDRWSYDWGDGAAAYLKRMKRKLDHYVDYKINMVWAHGFGWGTDLFAGFAEMARELNQYARARGIRLITGGYGASYGITYQSGPLYEEAPYLGQAFLNRASYPDGEVYECMGFHYQRAGGMNPRLTGSCRGNDELNQLKAEELREYVQKTEPGALYIHHEDFGGFRGTQQVWNERCDRFCKQRWPNDDLRAVDGGAGGLAHAYRYLVEAVQSVKNPETGYDAAKDCTIILTSPVYHTSSRSEEDWENVLTLWENISRQMPSSDQIQICFREIYPLEGTARRFIDDFDARMAKIDRPFKVFMFYAGGANYFINDYPVVSSAANNRSFLGAGSIYNGNSGFNQEPLKLIQAEYSWNVRSNGFYRDPKSYASASRIRREFEENNVWPDEIYGPGGLLERACAELYGPDAAKWMTQFHMLHELATESETPPGMWPRLYPLAVLWRNLALDRRVWSGEIGDQRLLNFMKERELSKSDLHEQFASRWRKWSRVTKQGRKLVEAAILKVEPTSPAREDLEHLHRVLEVGARFADLLVEFHGFQRLDHGDLRNSQKASLLQQANRLTLFIYNQFGTDLLDPSGGEIGAWLRSLEKLREVVSQ